MKEPMNFRVEKELADYLRGAVKAAGATMTEYIEGLISNDMESAKSIRDWDKGCVITSDRLIVVRKPYYKVMIDLIESGVGILAAIPDSVIRLEHCISYAKEYVRKDEDICYVGSDDSYDIDYVEVEGQSLASLLEHRYQVDLKEGII